MGTEEVLRQHDRGMLTDHQSELVRLLSHGDTIAMAAVKTGVTFWTCKDRLRRAREAIGARCTAHLVGIALRNGWID